MVTTAAMMIMTTTMTIMATIIMMATMIMMATTVAMAIMIVIMRVAAKPITAMNFLLITSIQTASAIFMDLSTRKHLMAACKIRKLF